MKVLVTGGTGRVGSEVVQQLEAQGASVRVLSRSKDAAAKLSSSVEVALGDMMDADSIKASLEGVDKLFLLNANAADELTQAIIAYDVAKQLKVKQVVYLSVFEAHRFMDVPHFVSKLAVEGALKQFDIPFTILRPSYFFQNDLSLKDPLTGLGVYPTPLGQKGVSAVDIRDIGAAAVIALTEEGHAGKTYNLVGPDVLSGPDAAAIWSKSLGKEIRFVGDSDGWEQQVRKFMPPWLAFELRMMFQGYETRGSAANPGDIEALTQLLGRAPRKYQDFARETAAAWQKS